MDPQESPPTVPSTVNVELSAELEARLEELQDVVADVARELDDEARAQRPTDGSRSSEYRQALLTSLVGIAVVVCGVILFVRGSEEFGRELVYVGLGATVLRGVSYDVARARVKRAQAENGGTPPKGRPAV